MHLLLIPVTHAVNTPLGHHEIQVPVAHAAHAPLAHAHHAPFTHHVVHAAPVVHTAPAHHASAVKVAAGYEEPACPDEVSLTPSPMLLVTTTQMLLSMLMRHLLVPVLGLHLTLILLLQ